MDVSFEILFFKKTIVEETTALPQIPCENKTKKVEHTGQNLEQYSDHKYTDSETQVEGVILQHLPDQFRLYKNRDFYKAQNI